MTRTIRQSVFFSGSPHDVYEALMDSRKHSEFTGAEATISREVGGKFTAYGGSLEGTNVELIPDTKIAQSWRADDENWPESHYSTAIFELEEEAAGTRLTFTQTEVPDEAYEGIIKGWDEYYWARMKTTFGW